MTDDVLNKLFSDKVLSEKEYTNTRKIKNFFTQNEELLLTICKKPDAAFFKLITALEETDQGHLAKLLTDCLGGCDIISIQEV